MEVKKRDFLYISDVCDAFYRSCFKQAQSQIFNLGFGKAESINKLAKMISNKNHLYRGDLER